MISKKMQKTLPGSSAIRAMFEKGAELKRNFGEDNVFDFSLGNPSLPSPPVVDETIARLAAGANGTSHGYMPNAGFAHVRERLASVEQTRARTAEFSASGVVVTAGAAAALNVAFKTILDIGDEVIVVAPYFVEYKFYCENHGSKVRPVMADPETFLFKTADITAAITAKTKAIILNSPNNPTGAVYPAWLLQELADALSEREAAGGRVIYVVSDEPYREIVYGGLEVPSIADFFHNAIICYSYSKSLSLAGERIGYIAVPERAADYERLMDALVLANRILGFVNANALFQAVIYESLSAKVDVVKYEQKRDALYDIVAGAGFSCQKPQGAFYLFVKSPIADDRVFCAADCLQQNILAAPGAAFGYPGYFRLAYCVSDNTINGSKTPFERLSASVAEVSAPFYGMSI